MATLVGLLVAGGAQAQTYYLDVNSTTNGSGIVEGGSYDGAIANPVWSTTAAGTAATAVRVSRKPLVFSAGTDATGVTYTVTGNLGEPGPITIEEGNITVVNALSAYSLTGILTADGTSAIFSSDIDFYNKTININTLGSSFVVIKRIYSGSTRSGGITKNGSGTLYIQGDAIFSGLGVMYASAINNGIVRIETGNAFKDPDQSAPIFTVNNGGTLELTNNLNMSSTPFSLSGMGYNDLGALNNYGGTNLYTWTNALSLAGDTRINASAGRLTFAKGFFTNNYNLVFGGAGVLIVSNAIHTGTGSIIKDGTGDLTLAGTNTYRGVTLVSNGMLVVKGVLASAGVTVSAPATLTGSGTVHWHPGEVVTVLGALDITQMNAVLHATGVLTSGDTVLVDYSASGATLTGSTFANVNRDEIPSESKLVYDTVIKKIVLRTPPRGTMVTFQ